MFNLSSNFLTHRDAWAGTFEQVVGDLTSPRTDCPGISGCYSLQYLKFHTDLHIELYVIVQFLVKDCLSYVLVVKNFENILFIAKVYRDFCLKDTK